MSIKNLIAVLLLVVSCSLQAATIKQASLQQPAGKTVISLTMAGNFTWKHFILSNPQRLVIDFTQMNQPVPANLLSFNNTHIQKVRTGQPQSGILRLVFDLRTPVRVESSLKNQQLTLVLSSKPGGAASTPQKNTTGTTPVKDKPIVVKNSPARSLRDVVVVLDAGHGGKDPGAKGPRNTLEKDVVLAIALKLKYLIDKQPGMRAVLTRKGDYYIGLRQRLNIARQYNGDIFVSIHADAFINQHSHGASVFALSQRGATSEAARWLAEKENYSELGGVNLADLDDSNGLVRSVLIDLSQTATINAGLQLGTRTLKQLGVMTTLHNQRVEQARFMVLKSPDIPSILVETGFISNPREEANLRNNAYQTRLSQSIFQGIKNYFWEYPPHGTRLEAMSTSNRHIVKAHETLPAIATQYKISVATLQKLNPALAKTPVKPGQTLVVPAQWA